MTAPLPGRLADRLAAQLSPSLGRCRVVSMSRATVGLSQETWFSTVERADGSRLELVLRLPTPASGASSIARQRVALQAAAAADVPVPALRWWGDDDRNAFGGPFLVMDRVPGQVPAGWADLEPARRLALAEQAIDALALLHGVDARQVADRGLRHPPDDAVGAELAFYRRQLGRVGAADHPVVRLALAWLARHRPAPADRLAFVHGDYRMGNFVVDDRVLVAVLDWEMAGIGHPAGDLAWCFLAVWQPAGLDVWPLYERYARRSGAPVDPAALAYFTVLGYLRLVFYAASGYAAFRSGADDVRLLALRYALPVHLDRLVQAMAGEDPR